MWFASQHPTFQVLGEKRDSNPEYKFKPRFVYEWDLRPI